MSSAKGPRPLLVVAGVIEKDGLLLLARRPAGKARAGSWEFPGGKVEPWESPEEALVRELREEMGVSSQVKGFLAEVVHAYPEVTIRLRCYLVTLSSEPTPLEGQTLSWFRPEEISSLPLAPADRKIWELLKSRWL